MIIKKEGLIKDIFFFNIILNCSNLFFRMNIVIHEKLI